MDKALYVSFENAIRDIFKENAITIDAITPADGEMGKIQVISTMGLSGDIWGNIVFGCSFESAQALIQALFQASGLVPQEKTFGDLHKATISEFANQITGRALMHLSQKAIDCQMTPPTVLTGNWIVPGLSSTKERFVTRMEGGFGLAYLHVGVSDVKKVLKK